MNIPDADVADLLLRASRRLRRATADELTATPLNPHQARALRAIGRHEPLRMADLAARLHVAPRSATEVADTLDAGGWITREPDPNDQRARLVRLTPAGHTLLAAVSNARARAASSTLAPLTTSERAHLASLLSRLGPRTE